MPPQMEYHCEETRIPSVCGSQDESLDPVLTCMLVGDGAVGKTSMIVSYTTNGYPTEYRQTAFDVFSVLVQVDGVPVRIQLMDTAGQEEFDGFRSLSYSHIDVFILCFSVVNPTSFQNVTKIWVPEIRAHNPSSPIVLVGTQADLRFDVNVLIDLDARGVKPVQVSSARGVADKIRAAGYVECSALTQKNLKEAFDTAIFAAVKHKARKAKKRLSRRSKAFSKYAWRKFFCFV
ncbi:rho-related GTP-binding protein RhoV-like [Conger conger]|uniref:rho-related GTP-binding protein RhoV-like n=1 Tax=Conger conger TaxID=82655 RepID=UPI002A5A3B26|nr:rho-related GTP-binding protein RhoV-like [Conger conger]